LDRVHRPVFEIKIKHFLGQDTSHFWSDRHCSYKLPCL